MTKPVQYWLVWSEFEADPGPALHDAIRAVVNADSKIVSEFMEGRHVIAVDVATPDDGDRLATLVSLFSASAAVFRIGLEYGATAP